MKPVFASIELANQANEFVGKCIEKEGQKVNPKYKADRYCEVKELPSGKAFMTDYHEELENCGIAFEMVEVTAEVGQKALTEAAELVQKIMTDQANKTITDPAKYSLEAAEKMKQIAEQVI